MRVALVLLVLAAMAGCGRGVPPGDPPPKPELPEGREFLSTEVVEGGKPKDLASGSRIRLSFADDGELRANAGCNHLMGNAHLEDGRLIVDGIGGTEMGCPDELMQQDQWLTDFLTSKPRWSLSGDELTLTGKNAEIRLADRRVADPDRPLRGTKWVLDTIIDGDVASSVPADVQQPPFLKLSKGQRAGGYSGCNQFSARVSVSGDILRTSNVISTLRHCGGGPGDVEKAMLEVLNAKNLRYEIEADRLTLTAKDGKGLGFTAAR